MARSLITGCAGFIGSHMSDLLIAEGHKVYGVDNLSTGKRENINKDIIFLNQDLTDFREARSVIAAVNPDYIFHFAALARIQPSIEDPVRWNDNNTNATLNVLEAARQVGVKKVVFSGSSSVYGNNEPPYKEDMTPNPLNPYALTKHFGERLCNMYSELYGLDTTVLRYFNVYGPRQVLEGDYATVIGIFLRQKLKGESLTIVGDGEQRRDFTWVGDICEANLLASQKKGFGIYNIGTGKNYSINEIAKIIEPNEARHRHGFKRKKEARITLANNEKAKKELGWKPKKDIKEGIDETRNYM